MPPTEENVETQRCIFFEAQRRQHHSFGCSSKQTMALVTTHTPEQWRLHESRSERERGNQTCTHRAWAARKHHPARSGCTSPHHVTSLHGERIAPESGPVGTNTGPNGGLQRAKGGGPQRCGCGTRTAHKPAHGTHKDRSRSHTVCKEITVQGRETELARQSIQ